MLRTGLLLAGRFFAGLVGLACLYLAPTGFHLSPAAAADKLPDASEPPTTLVTTNTRQFYRFHFSGLQSADAVRLAGQIWPVIAKLPNDNPLRRAVLEAKDTASFADDYRSLRNCLLEAGVDTIYFLADDQWIETTTLPGRVVMPGTIATRDRLEKRLRSVGHKTWADAIAAMKPVDSLPGWLTSTVGNVPSSSPSVAKQKIVEHGLKVSCPLKPAAVNLSKLPSMQVGLNDAIPLTVVNLERNKLDLVLSQVLPAIVPSMAQTVKLSENVEATTVSVSAFPFPYVRQVSHCTSDSAAKALSTEVSKQINGTIQKSIDMDSDFGPLVGLFVQSMVVVSTQGSDVSMVMKPPLLFDLEAATRNFQDAQDQDWTALPPPSGYHWEMVGTLGGSARNDVMARVAKVHVRGSNSPSIAAEPAAGESAVFRIPVQDFGMLLTRDLRGNYKLESAKKGAKAPPLPALELFDDADRPIALLRLDLLPGDPRYDLARTRSAIAKAAQDHSEVLRVAKKELDDTENEHQKAVLEKKVVPRLSDNRDKVEWEEKLNDKNRSVGLQQASLDALHKLDNHAREMQRKFPATTLVKNGSPATAAGATSTAKRDQFRFAGLWAFDYGVLTMYQDSSGTVAGLYSSERFQGSGMYQVDKTKGVTPTAILSGKVQNSTLKFTLYDFHGRERGGKLILDADGLGGQWSMEAATRPDIAEAIKRTATSKVLSDPMRRALHAAEPARNGHLDRIDIGTPDELCFQDLPTGAFAGYWVHATDKKSNTLLKVASGAMFDGASGSGVNNPGTRCAGCGNVLLVMDNPIVGLSTPNIREAILSADGQKLSFLSAREIDAFARAVGANAKAMELTRDSK